MVFGIEIGDRDGNWIRIGIVFVSEIGDEDLGLRLGIGIRD